MELQAGFARRDITPDVGSELAGFGPILGRRSTRVLAPLYANAVAVDDGRRRWVLVSADLLGVSAATVRQVREEVARRTGYVPHEVAVHATHNHSAPGTVQASIGWGTPDPFYVERLRDELAGACADAIRDLHSAVVRSGHVPLQGFAYNRMRVSPPAPTPEVLAGRWLPSFAEETDQVVRVIRFDRAGLTTGFVVTFSCHPVVCSEATTAIHGDFPGVALEKLTRNLPHATGIFVQGAMGDVNPVYAHGPPAESEAALDVLADRFARATHEALTSAVEVNPTPVDSIEQTVTAPLSQPSLDELEARLEQHRAAVRDRGTMELSARERLTACTRSPSSRP